MLPQKLGYVLKAQSLFITGLLYATKFIMTILSMNSNGYTLIS